jgi:hypothetical protein
MTPIQPPTRSLPMVSVLQRAAAHGLAAGPPVEVVIAEPPLQDHAHAQPRACPAWSISISISRPRSSGGGGGRERLLSCAAGAQRAPRVLCQRRAVGGSAEPGTAGWHQQGCRGQYQPVPHTHQSPTWLRASCTLLRHLSLHACQLAWLSALFDTSFDWVVQPCKAPGVAYVAKCQLCPCHTALIFSRCGIAAHAQIWIV